MVPKIRKEEMGLKGVSFFVNQGVDAHFRVSIFLNSSKKMTGCGPPQPGVSRQSIVAFLDLGLGNPKILLSFFSIEVDIAFYH